jgi:hypothetical protein
MDQSRPCSNQLTQPRPNQFHTQVSKITGLQLGCLGQLPAANFTLINNAIAALGRLFDVFFLLSSFFPLK